MIRVSHLEVFVKNTASSFIKVENCGAVVFMGVYEIFENTFFEEHL